MRKFRVRPAVLACLGCVFLCLLFAVLCAAGDSEGPGTRPAGRDGGPDIHNASAGEYELDGDLKREAEYEPGEAQTQELEYELDGNLKQKLTVTALKGQKEGPAVYLVAGIHGDEKAGWMAGERLKSVNLAAGTLCILSPANLYGAGREERKTEDGRDLNRRFPGKADGFEAERIADAIYRDIKEKNPVLVLDLHEAHSGTEEKDALGNSLICQSLDGIGDLVLDILTESEGGNLCSDSMTLYGSPPSGSLNKTVTTELGIPVITIETYREEPLEQRIQNHLDVVLYILHYYGMEEKR